LNKFIINSFFYIVNKGLETVTIEIETFKFFIRKLLNAISQCYIMTIETFK